MREFSIKVAPNSTEGGLCLERGGPLSRPRFLTCSTSPCFLDHLIPCVRSCVRSALLLVGLVRPASFTIPHFALRILETLTSAPTHERHTKVASLDCREPFPDSSLCCYLRDLVGYRRIVDTNAVTLSGLFRF